MQCRGASSLATGAAILVLTLGRLSRAQTVFFEILVSVYYNTHPCYQPLACSIPCSAGLPKLLLHANILRNRLDSHASGWGPGYCEPQKLLLKSISKLAVSALVSACAQAQELLAACQAGA